MGPQQKESDTMNSGVYVANLLCLWSLGVMEIPSEMDVMATRRRFLELVSMPLDDEA